MAVRPIHDWVQIKKVHITDPTEADRLIVKPDTAKEPDKVGGWGRVIAMGPGTTLPDGALLTIYDFVVGDIVLIAGYERDKPTPDGPRFYVRAKDVLGVLEQ